MAIRVRVSKDAGKVLDALGTLASFAFENPDNRERAQQLAGIARDGLDVEIAINPRPPRPPRVVNPRPRVRGKR